jgi:sugar lactone lactonase YvrE/enterochelin esterase-like enzyme
MKRLSLPLAASLTLLFATSPAWTQDAYPLGPDSKEQPGVPKGEVLKFTLDGSKVFPGTTRNVSVYVPKQYDPAKPACVWVNQDGIQHKAPVVFDNLIAKGEMPVTIYVAASPGVVKSLNPDQALDRFNRSFEYDGLGEAYARFVLEELLPFVEAQKTSDGRAIVLSKNGNDRCIGGASSGAICAFTAAWEKPQEFRRVFSTIGTYVGLRGGDGYHTLVRKTEPKPLRIFLQDGDRDLNIYGGDWWMANQTMERALTWAGYEVQHVWGTEGHNGKHGDAIFPDAVRWIWKDWPAEPKAGASKNGMLNEILLPGEGWQLVGEGYKFTEGPASNAQGEVFFNDVGSSKTYKVSAEGKAVEWLANSKRGDGQAFGPDGKLYANAGETQQVLAWEAVDDSARKRATVVAEGFRGNDLVVLANGNAYVTEPGWDGTKPSQIWVVSPKGEKKVVDTGLKFSNGITASPDQSLLYVSDSRSHWVYSYQIQPDGTLKHKQRYFHLHEPDTADDSGADGLEVDNAGRLYVATRIGIQVCDQAGRVNCIIPTPNGKVSNLVFGGAQFDTLYATCGDKVYRRKVKAKGAPSFLAPVKPAPPRL